MHGVIPSMNGLFWRNIVYPFPKTHCLLKSKAHGANGVLNKFNIYNSSSARDIDKCMLIVRKFDRRSVIPAGERSSERDCPLQKTMRERAT
jgi:hypothetical protein